ncbi:MAG: hypothetical protein VX777_04990 [Chlamydiota bacterium]|nr:hypothetical protein [Chlamydiota bacterium]
MVFSLQYSLSDTIDVSIENGSVIACQKVKIGGQEYQVRSLYNDSSVEKEVIEKAFFQNMDTIAQYIAVFKEKYSENVNFVLNNKGVFSNGLSRTDNEESQKLGDFNFQKFIPAERVEVFSQANSQIQPTELQIYVQQVINEEERSEEVQNERAVDSSSRPFIPVKRVSKTSLDKFTVSKKIKEKGYTHVVDYSSSEGSSVMAFFFLCVAAFTQDSVETVDFADAIVKVKAFAEDEKITESPVLSSQLECGIDLLSKLYYSPTTKLLREILIDPQKVKGVKFLMKLLVLMQNSRAKDGVRFSDIIALEKLFKIQCTHFIGDSTRVVEVVSVEEGIKGVAILWFNNRFYTIYNYDLFKIS